VKTASAPEVGAAGQLTHIAISCAPSTLEVKRHSGIGAKNNVMLSSTFWTEKRQFNAANYG